VYIGLCVSCHLGLITFERDDGIKFNKAVAAHASSGQTKAALLSILPTWEPR
jgi:hypothetical protein